MKYRVTKMGMHFPVYAEVARDGSVLWRVNPHQSTELSLVRAAEVAKVHDADVVKVGEWTDEDDMLEWNPVEACPDCGGDCDAILDGLRKEVVMREVWQ